MILSVFIMFTGFVNAQVNRYVVHFTDKEGTIFSVDNPETFLSQKAIARRTRYNISITEEDFPVNSHYMEGVRDVGAEVYFQSRWFNALLIQADISILESIRSLSYVDSVEYVAPGEKLSARQTYARKDMGTTEVLEAMVTNEVQNEMMGISEMHDEGLTGSNILVAVFDAGFQSVDENIYFKHIFDNDRMIATMDYLTNSEDVYKYDDHGTNVLSCIAGYKEGDYISAAYNADIILCVTEDVIPEYRIEEYNWLFAAEMADSSGVDIINTSLGYNTFDDPSMNYTYEDMDGNTTIISRATNIAVEKGILCVVSMGNEGDNTWRYLVAPADVESILAVGAVTDEFQPVGFSSIGPSSDGRLKPEVSALGYQTVVVETNNNVGYGYGTSFATPLITGLAAALWEAYPDLNNEELIELIVKGSNQYHTPDNIVGHGVPNFINIKSVVTTIEDSLPEGKFRVYPNPVKNETVFIESTRGKFKHDLIVQLYNLNGQVVVDKTYAGSKRDKRIEMDFSKISRGIYLLYIIENDISETIKLIVP